MPSRRPERSWGGLLLPGPPPDAIDPENVAGDQDARADPADRAERRIMLETQPKTEIKEDERNREQCHVGTHSQTPGKHPRLRFPATVQV